MTDQRIVISVPEAAGVLGISVGKAWDLARRGQLPGVLRIGHSVKVSKAVLEEWVTEQARSRAAYPTA
jgi:excisionase family DNA binding protein